MTFLLEPLSFPFFRHALLAGVLLGVLCGVLGCFVVLRGMAFVGDAMAHSALPGVALAYFLRFDVMLGAFGAALATALSISALNRVGKVKEDTAIGIAFTGAFALGIALMSRGEMARDLTHLLFGDILGITSTQVFFTALVAALVLGTLWYFYRPLLVFAFDPTFAASIGMKLARLHLLLMVLLSMTIVVGIRAVGVALIAALLVTPPATARLLCRRLPPMMLVAALCGALSVCIGMYVSYYAAVASGAAIVLTATLLFALALSTQRVLARRIKMKPTTA